MIKFSIICPVYNRDYCIEECIQSVQNQSYQNWEMIIVDDGSSDNTKKKVFEHLVNDSRIKYLYQSNNGQAAARNLGILNSIGDYICFLDSDDYYFDNHLSILQIMIENNKIEALFCTGFFIKKKQDLEPSKLFKDSNCENSILYSLFYPISFNSLCIPKYIVTNFLFDLRWRNFEDTHLLVRLLLKYPFIQGSEYTCVLNNHPLRGTYTIYREISVFEKIENNISAIKDLFDKVGSEILRITNKPYLREYLVSEKYIHHSNGALIYGMPLISFQLILKAIKSDPKLFHIKYYFKYFLKYPIYSIYYFLKSKL